MAQNALTQTIDPVIIAGCHKAPLQGWNNLHEGPHVPKRGTMVRLVSAPERFSIDYRRIH